MRHTYNSLRMDQHEECERVRTLVLDGLALALRGAFGDGATHEDDELLDAGTLEVSEVAYVRSIRQYHWIRSILAAFQNQ